MKNTIVVIGASGHAKVVMDIIELEGKYRIAGLIDTYKPAGELLFGYEILGAEETLAKLVSSGEVDGGIITIGDNWVRHLMAEKIRSLLPDFNFIRTVHPSASVARGVTIGGGSVLMAGVVVNSESKVGEFCVLNSNASLDHDSVMEDFSSLAPNATTGGNVSIGAFSAVSMGANILHGLNIGKHSVVGAGAVVLDDVPEFCVAYGVPARVISKRHAGDKYL